MVGEELCSAVSFHKQNVWFRKCMAHLYKILNQPEMPFNYSNQAATLKENKIQNSHITTIYHEKP